MIIWACGYQARKSYDILDSTEQAIPLLMKRGAVELDEQARVLACPVGKNQASASPVPNLYATGLGYGLNLSGDRPEGLPVKADGVEVYLKRAATIILSHVLGTKVFGEGCVTWDQHCAENWKRILAAQAQTRAARLGKTMTAMDDTCKVSKEDMCSGAFLSPSGRGRTTNSPIPASPSGRHYPMGRQAKTAEPRARRLRPATSHVSSPRGPRELPGRKNHQSMPLSPAGNVVTPKTSLPSGRNDAMVSDKCDSPCASESGCSVLGPGDGEEKCPEEGFLIVSVPPGESALSRVLCEPSHIKDRHGVDPNLYDIGDSQDCTLPKIALSLPITKPIDPSPSFNRENHWYREIQGSPAANNSEKTMAHNCDESCLSARDNFERRPTWRTQDSDCINSLVSSVGQIPVRCTSKDSPCITPTTSPSRRPRVGHEHSSVPFSGSVLYSGEQEGMQLITCVHAVLVTILSLQVALRLMKNVPRALHGEEPIQRGSG